MKLRDYTEGKGVIVELTPQEWVIAQSAIGEKTTTASVAPPAPVAPPAAPFYRTQMSPEMQRRYRELFKSLDISPLLRDTMIGHVVAPRYRDEKTARVSFSPFWGSGRYLSPTGWLHDLLDGDFDFQLLYYRSITVTDVAALKKAAIEWKGQGESAWHALTMAQASVFSDLIETLPLSTRVENTLHRALISWRDWETKLAFGSSVRSPIPPLEWVREVLDDERTQALLAISNFGPHSLHQLREALQAALGEHVITKTDPLFVFSRTQAEIFAQFLFGLDLEKDTKSQFLHLLGATKHGELRQYWKCGDIAKTVYSSPTVTAFSPLDWAKEVVAGKRDKALLASRGVGVTRLKYLKEALQKFA